MRLRREDWLGNDIVFKNEAALATGITLNKNLGAESFVGGIITIDGDGDNKKYIAVVKVVGAVDTITLTLADDSTLVYTRNTGLLKTTTSTTTS